jgi:hypothetical protein
VIVATRLLWISVVITVFFTVTAYVDLLPFRITGGAVISNLITAAFLALCAVKIRAGRNWARWLMLIIFALGALMTPLLLILIPQMLHSMPALLIMIGVLQSVIQGAALLLVFVPGSRVWFPQALVVR